MLKKLVVGALATGVMLSGAGGAFAAESKEVNNVKEVIPMLAKETGEIPGSLISAIDYDWIPIEAPKGKTKLTLKMDNFGKSKHEFKLSLYGGYDTDFKQSWSQYNTPATINIEGGKTYYLRAGVLNWNDNATENSYKITYVFK
nr:hypothetical protein [Bacillus mycoides]